jgi:hypothetical protein
MSGVLVNRPASGPVPSVSNRRGICPEGATQYSPGQRPGYVDASQQALKGRKTRARDDVDVSPFQGYVSTTPLPRALPWAVLFQPFGLDSPTEREGTRRGGALAAEEIEATA